MTMDMRARVCAQQVPPTALSSPAAQQEEQKDRHMWGPLPATKDAVIQRLTTAKKTALRTRVSWAPNCTTWYRLYYACQR